MTQAIKISKYDKLWLQELYKVIQNNERPSYRILRSRLYKSLPVDYNPDTIDNRLAQFNGEEIKLQGVNLIDPNLKVIDKANQVIEAIRSLIIQSPEKNEVTLDELAEAVDINKKVISFVLRLISPYGKFWSSALGNQEFQFGYGSFRIQNDNQVFDQYLYFTNIQDLLKQYDELSKKKNVKNNSSIENFESSFKEDVVKLNPIFKSKIDRVDLKLCFVLMPFKEIWSNEIYNLIRTTIETLGFQCLRADNLNGPIIIEDIWTKINQAGFIIADVTNRNPNVMYEVGIAHTVGRPTVLLTQDTKEIPFDFKHLRHIEYRNSVSGAEELRSKLKDAIDDIYKIPQNSINSKKSKVSPGRFSRKLGLT